MSWSELDYNWAVKRHVVHDSVVEIAKRDVEAKHRCIPVGIQPVEDLHIDPGGMIFMDSVIKEVTLPDGSMVSVRPELILSALMVWTHHRVLDEALPNGEKVIKVYCGSFHVAVMPESIYNKIGAWLAVSKAEGHVARMELVEALSDVPNLLILPPPVEGEA